jgi:NAD(P)-dependent dehydrogenase (short-subunit alcohol dehydrogenase family)
MVNIGSVGAFVGQPRTPAYTASKGAVLQLTRSIALDYAAGGLRCNCVCPGITDTPMLRYHLSTSPDSEAALGQRLRRVPLGVALFAHDIARAVLYLSCDDSAGITGTSLVVDGGYLAAAEWDTGGKTAFMEEPR